MAIAQLHLFQRELPPCDELLEDDVGRVYGCNKPARYKSCGSAGPVCLEHACQRHHPKYKGMAEEYSDLELDSILIRKKIRAVLEQDGCAHDEVVPCDRLEWDQSVTRTLVCTKCQEVLHTRRFGEQERCRASPVSPEQ